ncbi:RsmB/NOP family class I SAM-dependent RNA methyltransferase [Treponema bryantii]|uniref:RsmB/NOP family class I SAM-dependent RNA methyltransferase n=1 Tax=Treponema bryantii TaxID=163 RepID=UPI002B2FA2F5|nr:SAM-dependent methyltransferase [Treponema bryantii]
MKQKSAKNKLSGEAGFEEYYAGLYGERWQAIKESFAGEGSAVEYHVTGAEKSYFLDSASVLAALCLPLDGATDILDLCAAPGGKTLVLASRMPADAKLSSNERSPERKHRLSVVVETCLPTSISERVKTSCSDGATWCTRQSECFDRILLDAPCSSERHVIADPKYLNSWSPSRIKTVTTEQWSLLSSAYRLLSPEGILLYSTCALCPEENDGMIERLYKKFNKEGDAFSLMLPAPDLSEISDFAKITLPGFEQTKYGYMIMPDKQNGAGPIYFSIIKKNKSCAKSL